MDGRQPGGKLRVSICGGASIQLSDRSDIKITNKKALALLAFLVLGKTGSQSRERLSGLLWGDRGETQARASLRQCLKQIRVAFDAVGFDGFEAGRQDVSLQQDAIEVDLLTVFERLRQGDVAKTLLSEDGLPERILHNFDTLSESYTAWLHVIRQNWRNRLVEALQALLARSGDMDGKAAADALVNLDPTHEPAHRHLIMLYAEQGHVSAALRQYEQLWDVLETDYDVEPDTETQELIAQIKLGTFMRDGGSVPVPREPVGEVPAAPKVVAPRYPVLRVQRFITAGEPGHGNPLVEGFRQDLIVGLVRFRDWIILDGVQLQQDIRAANQTSDAPSFQIDGTLHEEGNQFHLVVTLKNVNSGQYVWSERIVLERENWASALRRFVMRISAGLSIYLTAREISRNIVSHELPNETYLQWLEAYKLIWSWDPAVRARAERIFREIISDNPSFAPAYSGLASIFNTEQIIYPGVVAKQDRLVEAAKFARIAVSLDPLDVRSQAALAWSSAMTGRHDLAENHHRLVHDLNPNNPVTLISCASGLAICGDTNAALRLSDEAVRILPSISPAQWGYLTTTRFICGDYAGCIEAADACSWALPVTPGWRAAAAGLFEPPAKAKRAGNQFMEFIKPRWLGTRDCTRRSVAHWFLQHCPIKSVKVQRRLRDGLAKAGLQADQM